MPCCLDALLQAAAQLEVCRLLLSLPVAQQHCPGRRKENLAAATLADMAVSALVLEYSSMFAIRAQCSSAQLWAEKGWSLVSNVGVGSVAAAVGAVLRSQWFTCGPRTLQLTNGFYADCQNCSSRGAITFQSQETLLMHNVYRCISISRTHPGNLQDPSDNLQDPSDNLQDASDNLQDPPDNL